MEVQQQKRDKSKKVLDHNRRDMPGGVSSMARKADPEIAFERAEAAYMWNVEGQRYIDYHAAFGPCILGHNDPYVNGAVEKALKDGRSLYGTGTNELEGRLAELMCSHIPACEMVQILNAGTEDTMAAIRLARAVTGRDHVIVIQGGFNRSHNDVACNVLTPLEQIGPKVSPGEYRCIPLGAGVPLAHQQLVHAVNFNDLDSVRYVCERYPIAALITEPVLQNLGVLKPRPGYLKGLREVADRYGFVLIFDEVKTGFRYSVGGYSVISGVRPDLVVYAKAIANGYPTSALGGKRALMERFADPEPSRRPFAAGTYNGHQVSVAAAIATIERLLENEGEVFRRLEYLGEQLQAGVESLLRSHRITGVVARQSSAFCIYFVDHQPIDWHDLAASHNFSSDASLRRSLIERDVYFFPVATKQCSISYAHTEKDISDTLEALDQTLRELIANGSFR